MISALWRSGLLLILLSYGSGFGQNIRSNQGRSDSTFIQAKEEYAIALQSEKPLVAAKALQSLGRLYFHAGQYPQSLSYYAQAGQKLEQLGEKKWLAENHNALGELYYYSKQPQQARLQYEQALLLFKTVSDASGIATTYGNIGHLYEKRQLYDSAFYYQQQALHQYLSAHNREGTAKIYENMGSIFEDLERYDSAQVYFQRALKVNLQTKDSLLRIEIYNNLGDILRKTGHFQKSLIYSRKAYELALQTHERHYLSGSTNDIGKAYHLMGLNDSAYHYVSLSRAYEAEIYSLESSQQLALTQTLFDTEKKNNEIERLTNERQFNQLMTIAVIIGLLLLIGLVSLAYNRQKMKVRNEQTLSRQNQLVYETQRELMQSELRNQQLQEEQLKNELAIRSKELSTHILHIIQKNQALEDLKGNLDKLIKDDKRDHKKQIKKIVQQINDSFSHDQYWLEFSSTFEQVHQSFFEKLRLHSDQLSISDLRLVALLKMNLTSSDISTLLGISQDSLRVTRYRLRKKLNLAAGESLTAFIQGI
ncbi:tetratricopeptide repeat protein [Siphonobacter sp. SORGH_AS_1065]|uniref:tetratricopeptide repeat protein n=1 Tax=Siphonobacter sp. SORGH_AS_1065 TaxID=3041795 RepID=UPI002780AEBD|nr:tetratricopeptide repeat protein [Siphonobacter sp. SORGH_AS_1065]MDQ1087307.1 tetratricopeptide (TPR) repeat protein [Siphonobacter sp. SORGH_AS_1065]